jgi:alkaline phosphatase D
VRSTRRELIAAGSALALAGAAPAWSARRHVATGALFSHGVASGMPATRSARLWTRLDGLEREALAWVEVARDPDFARVVDRRRVSVDPARDFTVHTRARGLKPGERYWYRFHTRDAASDVGTFVTARPAGSSEPLRIGFFSCQRYSTGWYTPHPHLAAEPDLDLVIGLGDYVYWAAGPGPRQDKLGANGDGNVQTLPEYRDKYRLYRSDRDLQAVHAAAPYLHIWDDNDVENNYTGDIEGTDGANRRVPWPERRANAYRACFEYLPIDRFSGDEATRIYRRVPLGIADVFLVDGRQYRDDQPCDDEAAKPCPEAYEEGRTMLGAAQKAWLKAELEASRAPWKVLANDVMMMPLDSLPYQQINNDQWDGYAAERAELMRFLVDRGIKDVTVLTGDIHTFFAGVVTTTGRIDGTAAATEFVGGSITSEGIAELLFGRDNEEQFGPLGEQLRLTNPHISYVDMQYRGYGVMEVRPEELRVEFKAVRTVEQPTSDVFSLQRFRVPRGEPRVET